VHARGQGLAALPLTSAVLALLRSAVKGSRVIGALQAVLVPPPLAVFRPARRSGWFVTGERELSYQLLNVGGRAPDLLHGRSRSLAGLCCRGEELTAMKIALLGTGFGQAHAAVYAQRPDVDEVIVFGRTPHKLATISGQFGFATTTDLDGLITDASVDLVDICLPTRLQAEVTVAAMQAGRDVLIELPLATTMEDAHRIVAAQQATGRRAFVDMLSRFSPASQHLQPALRGDDRPCLMRWPVFF
jgi:Oxidoreductase family, NAD-binding Rossmann fold